jgi:hypothetical protein
MGRVFGLEKPSAGSLIRGNLISGRWNWGNAVNGFDIRDNLRGNRCGIFGSPGLGRLARFSENQSVVPAVISGKREVIIFPEAPSKEKNVFIKSCTASPIVIRKRIGRNNISTIIDVVDLEDETG